MQLRMPLTMPYYCRELVCVPSQCTKREDKRTVRQEAMARKIEFIPLLIALQMLPKHEKTEPMFILFFVVWFLWLKVPRECQNAPLFYSPETVGCRALPPELFVRPSHHTTNLTSGQRMNHSVTVHSVSSELGRELGNTPRCWCFHPKTEH
ncbi:hypothetical protein DFS34DRAFT_296392 [Phlyctochytrium arcticum]|nr:hypothetical protein DFS34DRAFT_296392 [Phlyctochytrium arcticum]